MNRPDLIECLCASAQLPRRAVDLAVSTMVKRMTETLAAGEHIEIRGFGSFSLHYRAVRKGHIPQTGAPLPVPGKYRPYSGPGTALWERVNSGCREK